MELCHEDCPMLHIPRLAYSYYLVGNADNEHLLSSAALFRFCR
jgi:hypothetical protein